MKVVIEDYFGNDLCSFECTECTEFKNPKFCNIKVIPCIDEDGIEYMRVQVNWYPEEE